MPSFAIAGRSAFRLAHVRPARKSSKLLPFACGETGDEGDGPAVERTKDGRILSDNVYGSIEDDAWRRDFTITPCITTSPISRCFDYAGGMTILKPV